MMRQGGMSGSIHRAIYSPDFPCLPRPGNRTMLLLASRLIRRVSLILACAAAFAPAALPAQAAVRPGAFVRILAPSAADSLLTGTVVEIASASLLLAPPASGGSRTVALRDIERLEVRRQGGRRTLTGALVGTATGAVAGYAAWHLYARQRHCGQVCDDAEAPASAAAGVLGLLLGALIGSQLREPDRWLPGYTP